MLLVHILRVAGIYHGYRVALNSISVIPFIGIGHVIVFPSTDCWTTTRQCLFYGVDGKEGITHVAFHVLVRIGVAVLLAHVSVEASYLCNCTLGVEILILHLSRRRSL